MPGLQTCFPASYQGWCFIFFPNKNVYPLYAYHWFIVVGFGRGANILRSVETRRAKELPFSKCFDMVFEIVDFSCRDFTCDMLLCDLAKF